MRSFDEPRVDPTWDAGPYGWCRLLMKVPGGRGGPGYARKACGRDTVASVIRGRASRPQRWGYCRGHLAAYARIVRGDRVWWHPRKAATIDPPTFPLRGLD